MRLPELVLHQCCVHHGLHSLTVLCFSLHCIAIVMFVQDSYTFSENFGTGMVQVQLAGSISTAMDIMIEETIGGKLDREEYAL